jgi:hydroxypyruvate isomerase
MIEIVLDAGYRGWIGIEYEGNSIGEFEGIVRTKDLLEKIRKEQVVQV